MAHLFKSRRILVVDDNRDAANMAAALLEAYGHATATAYSARDALSIAISFTPEVIFLDINMPEVDGYQTALGLRKLEVTAQARIVALTACDDPDFHTRMTQVGFDFYLRKPASGDALLGALN